MLCVDYFLIILSIFFTGCGMCHKSEIMRSIVLGHDEFRYLCSVAFEDDFVFACSILTTTVVSVSVSNMNQEIQGSKKKYYNRIKSMSVIAGSPHKNPTRFKRLPPGTQQMNVSEFYLHSYKITENDIDTDLETFMDFKVFVTAPAINFGFLKMSPLQWSDKVRPIPLSIASKELSTAIESTIKLLESPWFPVKACEIAGWHTRTSRKIFHHVLYVPKYLCRAAYCGYNLNACFDFLNNPSQVCFKSAYWGGPCAKDTGSALFCSFFGGGNIFAILTTAINCEKGNLPCVYTTMNDVIKDYEKHFDKHHPPPPTRAPVE